MSNKECAVLVETLYGEEVKLHSEDRCRWYLRYSSNEDILLFSSKSELTLKQAEDVFELLKDKEIRQIENRGLELLEGKNPPGDGSWKFRRK